MAKIKFRCPECNKKLSATERDFGRQGECPRCQAHFEVNPEMLEDPGPEADVQWDTAGEVAEDGGRTAATFELEGFEEEGEQPVEEAPTPPPLRPAEPFVEDEAQGEPHAAARDDDLGALAVDTQWVGQAHVQVQGHPLLRFMAACLRVVGMFGLAGGVLVCLALAALAVTRRMGEAPVVWLLIGSAAAFMGGAGLFAIGEFLAALPDFRDEARRQTDLLRAILQKVTGVRPRR